MSSWLLICYRTPQEPSAARVAAWRTLRQVGALAVAGGAYVVPDTKPLRVALDKLVKRIVAGGGTAFVLTGEFLDEEQEARVRIESEGMRSDEYRQVVKSARHFAEHVERESRSADYRFAEVESLEQELEKVRRQLELVAARDYFENPLREEARAAILAGEESLRCYVEEVYRRGMEPSVRDQDQE
jgi:hypothetical protein